MSEHDITLASFLLSVFAIILAPVLRAAGKGEVKGIVDARLKDVSDRLTTHDRDPNAHPNLAHTGRIEESLENLRKETAEQFRTLTKQIYGLRILIAGGKEHDPGETQS